VPQKRASDNTLSGLLEFALGELETPIRKGNRFTYTPYPKQEEFHRSTCLGRYVAGANRAGKSDAEVMEAIWWCTNTHPWLKRPESWGHGAIRGRFVVVDIVKGVEDIILPKLKRWCATSDLKNGSFEDSWDARTLTFTFKNGSTIQFLTHKMDLDKHGGVPLHFVFFDEIPPQNIFHENMMRLNDFRGFWVIAATAVGGMGWTFDRIWEPWENDDEVTLPTGGKKKVRDFIFCIQLRQSDNPYLEANVDDRSLYSFTMDEAERQIREEGAFTAKSGFVFPNFRKSTHVLEAPLPLSTFRNWAWYSSVDFGWNNPTAWLWHAVAPDGRIYTFAEAYGSKTTTGEWAQMIHEREAGFGKEPEVRVGDPAGNQHQMNTGTSVIAEYARRGIYIGTERIPKDPMIGIEKMQSYFAIQNKTGWGRNTPTWMISPNCVNLIRELQRMRFASYESDKKAYDTNAKEEVHKKDDHAFDSAKYFATVMPDLRPLIDETTDGNPIHLTFTEMMEVLQNDSGVAFVNQTWDTSEDVEDFDEYAREATPWDVLQ